MSSNDSLYPSRPDWPGGQWQWGHGVVLHNQGEGYQQPTNFCNGNNLGC